jgi:FAD synthetase
VATFFFHNDADFPEIVDFTHATAAQYGPALEVLHGDFKRGIEGLLCRTPVKAIILGTRR